MINIFMAVNSTYVDKAETTIFSIKRRTTEKIKLYLLNHSLNKREVNKFVRTIKKYNIEVEVISIDKSLFEDFPVFNFSVEMYYRILAQDILPDTVHKAIWIDADIVFLGDISELFSIEFDNKYIIACQDPNDGTTEICNLKKLLKISDDQIYFNSGLIVFNLTKIRKELKTAYIIDKCRELRDIVRYPDQDILNSLYKNKVKIIDWKKYNCQPSIELYNKLIDMKNVIVMHYSGEKKPWKIEGISHFSKYYWYERLFQGHCIECFIFTLRYLMYKLKRKNFIWR